MSRIVAPSISLANSLISADVLSAAHEGYKNTFIKASFNVSFNKNRLETETIFLREESIIKNQKGTIKKIRVGDLNAGIVGNPETHIFFVWPNSTHLTLPTGLLRLLPYIIY